MSYEGARFCGRCDQPIRSVEDSERYDVFSNSGPGATVEVHTVCPVAPRPRQTFPSRRR